MKNKLIDLNDHLFLQLERINAEGITEATMKREIERSKPIAALAKEIVSNARLALDSKVKLDEDEDLPKMLES